MNTKKAVWVLNLTKKFGAFTAVDNISFSVNKGEIFGFLGANGAGKSTTIRMLCGILVPTSGQGEVGCFDIMKESELIKQNIGYMSQKFSLYNDLKVQENINFYMGIYGVPKAMRAERKEWVINMTGLREQQNLITGSLPTGWKQKLALGCALIHKPPIVFLDEPTSGVDPISRRNFWAFIDNLAKEGTTFFVTTHYMEEAEYCDNIALIFTGRIVAKGNPQELKAQFASDMEKPTLDEVFIRVMKMTEHKKYESG